MTEREKELLWELADLIDDYSVTFCCSRDDDGIHILVEGKEVFVGFLDDSAISLEKLRSAVKNH